MQAQGSCTRGFDASCLGTLLSMVEEVKGGKSEGTPCLELKSPQIQGSTEKLVKWSFLRTGAGGE